jgi:hypothetical protein
MLLKVTIGVDDQVNGAKGLLAMDDEVSGSLQEPSGL